MKQSKYAINTRREKLLEYLRFHKKASVEQLSAFLKVSQLTIRRDLDALEKLSAIKRYFGGAEHVDNVDIATSYEEKKQAYTEEKRKIAKEAASYIFDGATVFMNSGTTVIHVLEALKNREVTVITNNALAYQLSEHFKGEILCTGGIYSNLTKAYIGDYSLNIINKINADFCILGVNAINATSGVMTAVLQEMHINEKMVERCFGKIIIVADGSKVGKVFSFVSVGLEKIDLLITNTSASREEVTALRAKGIEVILVN